MPEKDTDSIISSRPLTDSSGPGSSTTYTVQTSSSDSGQVCKVDSPVPEEKKNQEQILQQKELNEEIEYPEWTPQQEHSALMKLHGKRADRFNVWLKIIEAMRYGHKNNKLPEHLEDLPSDENSSVALLLQRITRFSQRTTDLENYYQFRCARVPEPFDELWNKTPLDHAGSALQDISFRLIGLYTEVRDAKFGTPFLNNLTEVPDDLPHVLGPLPKRGTAPALETSPQPAPTLDSEVRP